MIISFGWTTPALLAGRKTVTRRDWNPKHAARFKAGMEIDAWNTSPRNVKGNPHKVATIRLTADPYLEWTDELEPGEYEAEGFAYLDSIGARVDGFTPGDFWEHWQFERSQLYVVRFELMSIEEGGV